MFPPVNLDDPEILGAARSRLPAPSTAIRSSAERMVYAVAMRTIRNFERSLQVPVITSTAKNNGVTYVDLEQGMSNGTATTPARWRFQGSAPSAEDWLDLHIDF